MNLSFLEQNDRTDQTQELRQDDFIRIFQEMPRIKTLVLRNSGQFKNGAIEYLTGSTVNLQCFDFHAPNLIDDDHWNAFICAKGSHLESFELHWLDAHFHDAQVALVAKHCPKLRRF